MDRLTERNFRLGFDDSNKLPRYGSVYKKLREYENLDEEGCLLMLPCAVGSTVYTIFRGEIYEEVVRGILFTENKIFAQDGNGNILGEFEGNLFLATPDAKWAWKETEDKNAN